MTKYIYKIEIYIWLTDLIKLVWQNLFTLVTLTHTINPI